MYECREAHGCAGAAGITPLPLGHKKTGPEGPVSLDSFVSCYAVAATAGLEVHLHAGRDAADGLAKLHPAGIGLAMPGVAVGHVNEGVGAGFGFGPVQVDRGGLAEHMVNAEGDHAGVSAGAGKAARAVEIVRVEPVRLEGVIADLEGRSDTPDSALQVTDAVDVAHLLIQQTQGQIA